MRPLAAVKKTIKAIIIDWRATVVGGGPDTEFRSNEHGHLVFPVFMKSWIEEDWTQNHHYTKFNEIVTGFFPKGRKPGISLDISYIFNKLLPSFILYVNTLNDNIW